MPLKHYWNLLTGKVSASAPAKVTFANVKAVLQAFFRSMRRKIHIDGVALPQHQWEQIVWRRTEVRKKSYWCWKKGACTHCGCEILGKTMEDRGCEGERACYPPMMDVSTWNKYKLDNDIKLFD